MDVLIKSFNRPYYLDRCIQSIYENVVDSKLSIKVLDDGTPVKYLEKIQKKFPKIEIIKSEFYLEKSKALEKTSSLLSTNIPIKLWLNAAQNATDYFLLLEDDIWFTEKINLEETHEFLEKENIFSLKLFWLNNLKLVYGKTIKTDKHTVIYKPAVFTKNPVLHRIIFRITRYNNRKIMRFLKLYSDEKALQYYSIYNVAGAVFHKKYFLSLWNHHQNQVDEHLQLRNAVKFWHSNTKMQFARTEEEVVATGFSSSATNKNYETGQFDVFAFNKILNEAWFHDEINVMDNYPDDLNNLAIERILLKENNPKAQVDDWNKWVFSFRKQFQDIGCKI
jgi:hypothetical protein